MVVFYAIIIVPFWFICKKAGFSPWLSLLNLIPLGGIILMYVLAFADWNVVPVAQAVLQPLQPGIPAAAASAASLGKQGCPHRRKSLGRRSAETAGPRNAVASRLESNRHNA